MGTVEGSLRCLSLFVDELEEQQIIQVAASDGDAWCMMLGLLCTCIRDCMTEYHYQQCMHSACVLV